MAVVIAAALAMAGAILIAPGAANAASGHVFWSNLESSLGRANLDGTGVNQSLITGGDPHLMAVDATHVYWANAATGSVGRANLDGTGTNQSFITGGNGTYGVAVDATHIYWSNLNGNAIGRANLDGTGVNQSFITGLGEPYGIAVTATTIYWTNFSTDSIGRANINGTGANASFITGGNRTEGLAVDAAHVYWANQGLGKVGRANLDGTGVNQTFIDGAGTVGVAVDATYVYWANQDEGKVGRANLDGTGVNQSFITGGTSTFGVAVEVQPQPPTPPIAQVPLGGCVTSGGTIPRTGEKRLAAPGCVTNAGQHVGVRVSATLRLALRGDLRYDSVFCRVSARKLIPTTATGYGDGSRYCKRGALKIRTYGHRLRVRVIWSAPAIGNYLAYSEGKTYRT
ncbi:MAG: hypothetical protein WCI74_13390 [Actinomycetes bacterium]